MEKKVNQIQKEVDDLIRLCADAGVGPDDSWIELDKYAKLGYLVLKLQDEDLEREHIDLLEEWLSSDREALEYYIEFQNLNAMLYSYFNKDREKRLLEKMQDVMAGRESGCSNG